MNTVMHANDHSDNVLPADNNSLEHDNSALEVLKRENVNELQAQLKAKNVSIEKLKEHIANIKRKNVVESGQNVHNSNVVTSKVYKLDLQPLSPLELPVYVSATCLSLKLVSKKLVAVTPINRDRKVSSTEASGSKPRSNTKKDRITQTSSSKKKTNKVEDQPRISKSSLNNTNRVSKEVCNANVKRSVLNVNSKLICATCHEFMFDAIHGLCVSDYLNDVNARVKSKSVKSRSAKCKKKEMWKPTGTDKTKITRKPSKMGKHGLEKQKSTREP
ncbi:hypothetical protein Tco_1456226 [Tanacetum coccineum]